MARKYRMSELTYKQVGGMMSKAAALKKAKILRNKGWMARTRQVKIGKYVVEKCKK